MRILAILGVTLLLLVGAVTPALAFNPQPEPPGKAISIGNQMNAVSNSISAIEMRLSALLSSLQSDGMRNYNGTANWLEAKAHQLGVLNGEVGAMLAVPGLSLDDPMVAESLREVREGARAIARDIDMFLGTGGYPDDAFGMALQDVMEGAQSIIERLL